MYRVYDNLNKKWDFNICVTQTGGFIKKKRGIFSRKATGDYTCQKCVDLVDRNENLVYEGDILKTPNGIVGMITYEPRLARFILLDYSANEYYYLTPSMCEESEIIGNNFENRELLFQNKKGGE